VDDPERGDVHTVPGRSDHILRGQGRSLVLLLVRFSGQFSPECASIREKYGDRFLYAVPLDEEYSTEEIPVCIDISDSRLVREYGIYSEPCALGIGALSDNVESVELFLDFLFE